MFVCLLSVVELSRSLPAIQPHDHSYMDRDRVPRNVYESSASFIVQLAQLLQRHGRHMWRDRRTTLTRLVVTVLLGLMVGA